MLTRSVEKLIAQLPWLEEQGMKLSYALHDVELGTGRLGRHVFDLLHGTWLGHPLHPMLTDVTIGTWTLGAFFDAAALLGGDRRRTRRAEHVADRLTAIGAASAVPTAVSGLADYATVQEPAVPAATLHALVNDLALTFYLLSLRDRRRGNRRRGVCLSLLAMGLMTGGAWLGGHLVYHHKVGVDHSARPEGPQGWTPVLAASDLPEGKPARVEVEGTGVLLCRTGGGVYALGAVCSHAGGPLEEGDVEDCYVTCPWHDSVFDLRDGSIRHGPATQPQPRYEARLHDGHVEIRRPQEARQRAS